VLISKQKDKYTLSLGFWIAVIISIRLMMVLQSLKFILELLYKSNCVSDLML